MDHAGENAGLADLKANLRRLYKMVAIGIMDNRETTKEIKNLLESIRLATMMPGLMILR